MYGQEEDKLMQDGDEVMKRRQLEREKQEMMKRLQAIGIQVDAKVLQEEEEEDTSRLGVLRKMKAENLKTQKAMMDLYRHLGRVVLAPHSMHITSGRYRFYVLIEGFDVFDTVFPAPREAH
jgi:hypothetical protein